jgi:hypothetical protein
MKPLICIALLSALAVPAAAADEKERTVDFANGAIVTAKIDNKMVRLRVDFDAPANSVALNASVAKRIRIRGFHYDRQARIDNQNINTIWAIANFEIGDRWERRRVSWTPNRDAAQGADGVIGPMVLPENRVTYRLHAPVPGETIIEMPVHVDGRVGNSVRIGDRLVSLSFAPQKPQSVATAAAGAHVAAARDGYWVGPATTVDVQMLDEAPHPRPARFMQIQRPLSLSGLPLRSFMIRTEDFKGGFKLPPASKELKPADRPEADEIVVVGKSRTPLGGDGRIELALGQDALGMCSSIILDRRRRMMTLSCRTV